MAISVRLDPETEALIRRMARAAGRSKSWVVREAVAAYALSATPRRTPFEALAPFIGAGGTGETDLSERTGEGFTALVRTKAGAPGARSVRAGVEARARRTLVDAGPLIALLEPTDRNHARCVEALEAITDPLVTVWPAFTEAMYLLGGSARSQDALWSLVEAGGLDFARLTPDDAPGMRALMQVYGDQPMDLADAALVAVAEREGLREIFTLDRRHFEVYRIKKRTRFTILP